MADFKQNITNINKKDRDKYFQQPKDFQNYVDDKAKIDKSMEGSKIRMEEQLEVRKKYISLLTEREEALQRYIKTPTNLTKQILDITTAQVDLHNLEIEIIAQKNIFVDSYIYYKEDFMKRYKSEEGNKKSVFNKK